LLIFFNVILNGTIIAVSGNWYNPIYSTNGSIILEK